MTEEKKKIILWLSVSVIAIIIIIIWGFFLKQNLFSLKIKLQQKKEPTIQDLQFKENLEELKKSLEGFKQNFSELKPNNLDIINTETQNKNTKLSPEQIEKIKKEIKEAVEQKQ